MKRQKAHCKGRRTRPLSLTYIFGSFFGAVMVASAFAYFNFKFTEYKFLDFQALQFFDNRMVFEPSQDDYVVLVYSSKVTPDPRVLIQNTYHSVLGIDISQDFKAYSALKDKQFLPLLASMNTILQVVQRFNIYAVPSAFLIKRENNLLYKQNSAIEVLDGTQNKDK